MLSKYDIILIDADRTIFDTAKTEKIVLKECIEAIGHEYIDCMSDDYTELHEELWRQLERGEVTRDHIRKNRFRMLFELYNIDYDPVLFNREYTTVFPERCVLNDGVLDTCRELAESKRLAVITNGSKRVQDVRFGLSPVTKYFERIFSSEELNVSKPQREFFDIVLRELNVTDREKVLVVGDSLTGDIRGAELSGLDSCWFNPEYEQNTIGVPFKYEVHSFKELLKIE